MSAVSSFSIASSSVMDTDSSPTSSPSAQQKRSTASNNGDKYEGEVSHNYIHRSMLTQDEGVKDASPPYILLSFTRV